MNGKEKGKNIIASFETFKPRTTQLIATIPAFSPTQNDAVSAWYHGIHKTDPLAPS